MRFFEIKDCLGNSVDVCLRVCSYSSNDNMAIGLWERDGIPYAALTVNLGEQLPIGYAYLDTNNVPFAEEFCKRIGIIQRFCGYRVSGFCAYPLYEFDYAKLIEISEVFV